MYRTVRQALKTLAILIPSGALVIWLTQTFLVSTIIIRGSSMEPNLHDGETYILKCLSHSYQRGQIVVLKDKEGYAIKRIIGMPGETISFHNQKVLINGQPLIEHYLDAKTATIGPPKPIIVPADAYYVLGDNRNHSCDSREFGPVARNHIRGTLMHQAPATYPISTAAREH